MTKTVQPISVIYCDDIRQELGGKHSYMGVYGADLVLPSFPTTITRLCIAMQWSDPHQHKARELNLMVLLGDARTLLNTSIRTNPNQIAQQICIVLDPFEVQTSTTLSVKVKGGDREYQSMPLQITASEENT